MVGRSSQKSRSPDFESGLFPLHQEEIGFLLDVLFQKLQVTEKENERRFVTGVHNGKDIGPAGL